MGTTEDISKVENNMQQFYNCAVEHYSVERDLISCERNSHLKIITIDVV